MKTGAKKTLPKIIKKFNKLKPLCFQNHFLYYRPHRRSPSSLCSAQFAQSIRIQSLRVPFSKTLPICQFHLPNRIHHNRHSIHRHKKARKMMPTQKQEKKVNSIDFYQWKFLGLLVAVRRDGDLDR